MPEFYFQTRNSLSSTEARANWRDILDFMQLGLAHPINILRYGRPVAVILPYKEYKRLREGEDEQGES
jgi:prevent-host-death family protein